MKKRTTKLQDNEQGIVAIFTVLVVMGILTLLTIGFSNITRQAQRRTLDDQLSTQAFYAAETGINRARALMNNGTITTNKTQCQDNPTAFNYDVDSALGIGVSCLLVNLRPTSLEYESVPEIGMGDSIISHVKSWAADPIDEFTFSWDSKESGDPINPNLVFLSTTIPRLPSDTAWADQVGILRVDLIPVTSAPVTSLTRENLVNGSYSFFLYPGGHASTTGSDIPQDVGAGVANQGITVGRRCESTGHYRCVATVNLTGPTSTIYYMRVHSYYNATRVSVAAKDTADRVVEFRDGQAIVDSTGRVNDVSRRIQVRVPLSSFPGYRVPFSILSASSICKRLVVIPGASEPDRSDGAGLDPACQI